MALSIRSPEVERLARDLARRTGATLTEAIRVALDSRAKELEDETRRRLTLIESISDECGAAADRDSRSMEEILGYDEEGAFGHGGR